MPQYGAADRSDMLRLAKGVCALHAPPLAIEVPAMPGTGGLATEAYPQVVQSTEAVWMALP